MKINLVNFDKYYFNNGYKPPFCGHSISLASSGSNVPGQKQYFIGAFTLVDLVHKWLLCRKPVHPLLYNQLQDGET